MMGSGGAQRHNPQAVSHCAREYSSHVTTRVGRGHIHILVTSDHRFHSVDSEDTCWRGLISSFLLALCLTQKALIPSTPYRPSCPIFIRSLSRYRLCPRLGSGATTESMTEAIPAPWSLESNLEMGEEDQVGSGEAKGESDTATSLGCDKDLITPVPIYGSLALPIWSPHTM